jgi:hypothetical protein
MHATRFINISTEILKRKFPLSGLPMIMHGARFLASLFVK